MVVGITVTNDLRNDGQPLTDEAVKDLVLEALMPHPDEIRMPRAGGIKVQAIATDIEITSGFNTDPVMGR